MSDTATQTPVMPVGLGDVLHVKNKGSKPLVLAYDSRRHVIEPGATRPIPFEAAALYFGDPRSGGAVQSKRDEVGRVSFIADRATEVRRLRTLYDVHPQNVNADGGQEWGDETQLPASAIPNVEVHDYDGNPVRMVIHDPAGDHISPAQITVSENDQLRILVNRQQQMIETLAQRLGVDPISGRDVPAFTGADGEATQPADEEEVDPTAAIELPEDK